MRFLIRKAIHDSRWLWLACALALFVFSWLRVWLVAQLEMSNFQKIILTLGDEFQKFSQVPLEQLFTYLGRVARSFSEPLVTITITAWCTARGSDVVSGGISRGTLEMILAQPVSRRQVIVSHALVTTIGTALLCICAWLGIWAGVQTNSATQTVRAPLMTLPGLTIPNPFGEEIKVHTPMSEHLDCLDLLPGSLNLFAFGFFVGGFAAWMSSWDRFRWRTIGIVIGFLVLQSTILYFAIAVESVGWLGWLTVLSSYNPERYIAAVAKDPAAYLQWMDYDADGSWKGPGCLAANLTLCCLGLASYLLAARTFRRRDLPPPL